MLQIIKKLVPNYGSRNGNSPKFVVIHVGEGTSDMIYSTFLNEPKSSHYLCTELGEIWQFVDEGNAAWGCGILVRPTATILRQYPFMNPNLIAMNIENSGYSTKDIPDIQYQRNAELVADICQRYEIPMDAIHIIPHWQINGGKTCPGKIDVSRIIQMANDLTNKKIVVMEQQISLLQRLINAMLALRNMV